MRRSDGSLHFYVNGMDQGLAASGLPGGLYAVVDLYGKCAQVSICRPSSAAAAENALSNYIFKNSFIFHDKSLLVVLVVESNLHHLKLWLCAANLIPFLHLVLTSP